LNLHIKSASGFIEKDNNKIPTTIDQPYHIASIGKVFTAVLLYQLVEEKKLSLNDPISKILGPELLKDLFVYDGIDNSDKVTISHLLTHTSGIADYFESIDNKSVSILNDLTKVPDKFWTPL
jgi:D-alanyl-D-alanine carboxypeptidase